MIMDTESIRASRRSKADAAAAIAKFRKSRALDHPKVRYPGFHPDTVVFKAGTTAERGGRRLTVDIVRHECVDSKMRDGTTSTLTSSCLPLSATWPKSGHQRTGYPL